MGIWKKVKRMAEIKVPIQVNLPDDWVEQIVNRLRNDPEAEWVEIIRCKDCKYGEQDEVGRWFCRSLGCQIGNEDGSGYCADAERRTDEQTLVRKLSNQPAGGD